MHFKKIIRNLVIRFPCLPDRKTTLNKSFRPKKTWLLLGVALFIGLLAALAARAYLSTQMAAIEARSKSKTVNLVVAKRELKRGEKITADSVAVRAVPVDFSHSSAVTPETFSRIEGQTLAYPVRAGEMILWSLAEGKKAPTFSARVEVGHRAMTVPVDEINSISGLLEPGDVIDLMVTIDQKGKKTTLPLLQNVQVMATGQRSVDGQKEGERKQYSTVTIDATPLQARNIIVARDAGKITALLRNPEDKHRTSGGDANLAALLGSGIAPPTASQSTPVLYGGSSKIPPENLLMGSSGRTTSPVVSIPAEEALSSSSGLSPISVPSVLNLGSVKGSR
jgi:pilus assembly protein CpaB